MDMDIFQTKQEKRPVQVKERTQNCCSLILFGLNKKLFSRTLLVLQCQCHAEVIALLSG